jgi:hypothetical protein
LDERDVLRKWRDVFRGNEVNAQTLAQAEALLEDLSGESPLHLRLANELEELKRGPKAPKKKAAARRQST